VESGLRAQPDATHEIVVGMCGITDLDAARSAPTTLGTFEGAVAERERSPVSRIR
jgi:hypothetical protein